MSFPIRKAKVIVIGDMGVGKTALITRFIRNNFESNVEPTIGVSCLNKQIQVDDQQYIIELYDTAGQERYNSLVPLYFRQTNACIICFDLSSFESFAKVKFWRDLLEGYKKDVQILIMGCKSDLISEELFDDSSVIQYATTYGYLYFKCSSKTGAGVNEALQQMMRTFKFDNIQEKEQVSEEQLPVQKKGCC